MSATQKKSVPVAINLHECQTQVFRSHARFRVLVAGRRFGKTHLALVEMLMAAQRKGSMVWYIAPNDHQAKRIAWLRLKELTKPFWSKRPNESEKTIVLKGNSSLRVLGAFAPDSLRGEGVDFMVLDEYANMKPEVWRDILRAALADRKGRALFIGTPQGRNHFYETYERALNLAGWARFHFTTAQGGMVDEAELASAAADLDPDSFRQEFEAEFSGIVNNRAYYAFEREYNVEPVNFDGLYPLIWSIDFNVNPMCMLLMQQVGQMVHVLKELVIRPSANTEAACQLFLQHATDYNNRVPSYQRPLIVKVFGDASGNQRRTSGAQTDWALIKQFFSIWVGTFKPEYYTATANPAVRDRVNCVNSRLKNYLEERRLLIHPSCKELIRDLEEVTWSLDATGIPTSELDKSDKARTHASDALGYFISQAFDLKGKVGEKSQGPIV